MAQEMEQRAGPGAGGDAGAGAAGLWPPATVAVTVTATATVTTTETATTTATVAVGFEPCWIRAGLFVTLEQCRQAAGPCGGCAGKRAFLSASPGSPSACHVRVFRPRGFQSLFVAKAPVSM